MILLPRLYPIVDSSCRGSTLELMALAEDLASAGCTLLQYRNKSGHARIMLEQARELKKHIGDSVRLIMNDRADLCLAADFDGVHVGQNDLSPESVRKIIGSARWLGVSTHNPEQLREADLTSADYVAIGPVFATSSKDNPDPLVGLEGVRRARELTAQAAGRDWRDHAGECGLGDRGGGRFSGCDIRFVTGAAQISRGIFAHIEVKCCKYVVGRQRERHHR